ncbi:MAG: oligopeptide/dipeptide ABC transporter ATP-binding protein [Acidimicrobiales bacterium]|jgi:peptide/nickel transport system ATP-binding protein|nr:ATP-binding cassette domain-containing protein [Acidimicrobiales bacterium]MEE1565566.1 oligopeptide/dipeptide ABC transporter ATP-binding protein [Acidimicrobiales bacterium]|tara:strand:- start:241 stop:1230 length:990 start_codon:yes stop_codon:yes gene_type:complete
MAGTGKAHLRRPEEVLLRVEDLVVEYPAPDRKVVHAVSGISLDVKVGETLGLVGESGCGKTTTGKALLQLLPVTSGSVVLDGTDLTGLSARDMRRARTDLQMIFQDPISSLNPRRKIGDIVAEPLQVWGPYSEVEQVRMVDEMLEAVGMDPVQTRGRRPHEFSGGQCQRISIARSLVLGPRLLICDEPVSALDMSVQAQILNLLGDLKADYDLTLVFVAHDLAVIKNVSDRVAVMYLGKLCEVAGADDLYDHPAHPYTGVLLNANPEPDPEAPLDLEIRQAGELPSPVDPPSGCRFRTRCSYATEKCAAEEPTMRKVGDDHFVACHFPM